MKTQTGLTLIELMVTLAVMVVMLAFGVPLYQTMQANNRMTAQANELVTALQTARSEAVKQAATVTLCPKSSASDGFTSCGGSGNWANGFQVFLDIDEAGDRDSGTDEDLRTFPALSGNPTVTASAAYVQFSPTGEQTVGGLPSAAEVTLQVAHSDASGNDRCVRVSIIGQVRVHQVDGTLTCP